MTTALLSFLLSIEPGIKGKKRGGGEGRGGREGRNMRWVRVIAKRNCTVTVV